MMREERSDMIPEDHPQDRGTFGFEDFSGIFSGQRD